MIELPAEACESHCQRKYSVSFECSKWAWCRNGLVKKCVLCAQMPFIKKAPRVSFRKPIGSVSVSGHKFIGAPVPCGVVITRQKVCFCPNSYPYLRKLDGLYMAATCIQLPGYKKNSLRRSF